jgi:hypothetical protein
MSRKLKKEKPCIPEPSPRFLIFCAVAAGIVMVAAIAYGFVTGSRDFATPSPAKQAARLVPISGRSRDFMTRSVTERSWSPQIRRIT